MCCSYPCSGLRVRSGVGLLHRLALVVSGEEATQGLKIVTLRPHNRPEYAVLGKMQSVVRTSITGGGGAVTMPAMVAQFLDKQTAGDPPAATKGDKGWSLAGGGEIRKLDGLWFVVEDVSPTERRISVFDDKTR